MNSQEVGSSMISVKSSKQACGAAIDGIDLTKPLMDDEISFIKAAWLKHHILSFPNQKMNDDDLERFTAYFGGFGVDPFFKPIDGRKNIAAIRRDADEKSPLFAENWHSDWSFQEKPPSGTCLLGITIPPQGGDTLFANQHAAFDAMPEDMKEYWSDKIGIHSAQLAYAPTGAYGENDKGRSMDIIPDESAFETQEHPIIRAHPETGRLGVFSCFGYIIGIKGMEQPEAQAKLMELYAWQSREEFIYRHKWDSNMLIMWDNRSLLHCATGGYEGHDRLLHRTTIAA